MINIFIRVSFIIILFINFYSLKVIAQTNFDIAINKNSSDRSIVRVIDLIFETNEDIGNIVNSINNDNSQIKIWYNGMDGLLKNKIYINKRFYIKDKIISIDFYKPISLGPRSLGLRTEGIYKLELDLDNDSKYETIKIFHVLFGDIDGNRVVNEDDLIEIKKLFGIAKIDRSGDLNSDGIVDDLDFNIVLKSIGKSIKVDVDKYSINFSPPEIWTGDVALNISKSPEIKSLKLFIENRQVDDFFYNPNYKFPSQSTRDASNLESYVLGYDNDGNQISKSKSNFISLANKKKKSEWGLNDFFWRPPYKFNETKPNDENVYPRLSISSIVSGRMRMSMNSKKTLASGLKILIDEKPVKIIDPPSFSSETFPWYPGHENYFYPWSYEGGDVDTFAYRNGIHTLTIKEFDSDYDNPNLFYQKKQYINFDNGHSPMALIPKYQEYVIGIGETIDLSQDIFIEYTDGLGSHQVPVTLFYKNGDEKSILIDGSQITGLRSGYVELMCFYQNRFYEKIRIRVGIDGFPHFGIGGEILHTYEKDKSIIPRSLFSSYDIFNKGDAWIKEYKNAKFNTFESGIYSNPWYWRSAIGSQNEILAYYNAEQDKEINKIILNSSRSGLHVIATGDEFARYGQYVWAYSYNYIPWSTNSFMHAFKKMYDSKRFIAVEMVDETGMMGSIAPNLNYARILKNGIESSWENNLINDAENPESPDYIYLNKKSIDPFVVEKLYDLISDFRIPMGWPLFSLTGSTEAYQWGPFNDSLKPHTMWKRVSDYHSWQLNLTRGWIHHPTTGDLLSYLNYLNFAVLDRQLSKIDPNFPLMMDWSADANNYVKNTSGINQVQGIDESVSDLAPIYDPSIVELQISYLIARGVSALRGYHFATNDNIIKALNTPIGSIVSDTGIDPFFVNTRGWRSVSVINSLIEELEPYLLQPYVSIINPKSSQIIVGARQGDVGSIYWTVSFEDIPVSVSLDLSQYLNGSTSIEIISLWQGQILRDIIDNNSIKNIILDYKPTETKIIVFKKK